MARGWTFHLSCYLTLALAAVCLGFAETFFLGWMPFYLVLILIVFALAWFYEGRWWLSEQGANAVGLAIAFGMIGWILFRLPRNEEELMAMGVPWPAGLLPHLGPLLMILTAVKLFRPKMVADFWVLQVLGVMMVTLASVLAGEMDHGVWIVFYLVCLIWSLTLFQRMQPAWASLDAAQRRQTPLFSFADVEGSLRFGSFPQALALSLVALLLGGGLFVVAPRHTNLQWIPHKLSTAMAGRLSAGLEAGMDLNRTGKIELSDEVAFEVTAQDAKGEPVALPINLYWRGEALDFYRDGRWYSGCQVADSMSETESPTDPVSSINLAVPKKGMDPRKRPVDMPAGTSFLSFHVLVGMSGHLVLAEPLDRPLDLQRPVGYAPHVSEHPRSASLFTYLKGADVISPPTRTRREPYRYGQVVDLGVNPHRQSAGLILTRHLQSYLEQSPPPDLLDWSRTLLARLPDLTAEEKTLGGDMRVPLAHRAKVAQAVSRHFSESGEYLYSLNLRRVDTSKDVNVDFLLNVKEGHCERYASGLALTLRAVGIPTRVIHGFRGCENVEPGQAVVRFNQAHSWVQALVPSADGKGNDWILLDPTPSQEAPLSRWQQFCEWLDSAMQGARTGFRNFVLDYGSDQQKARMRGWWASISANALGWIAGAVAVVLAVGLRLGRKPLGRWLASRRAARLERARLPWLADALAIVADKTGQTPAATQTLLEFAANLRDDVRQPFDALARLANRTRFGGPPLSADERREVTFNIDRMRTVVSVL